MDERGVRPAPLYSLIPGLTAAVAANPAATADFAVAAIDSISNSSSQGCCTLPAVLGALTSALAPAEDATRAAVCEHMSALLANHPTALAPGCSTAGRNRVQAVPPPADAAVQVKRLAVAAVLSRHAGIICKLQRACQAEESAGVGLQVGAMGDPALLSALAPHEQSALLHHLLLCPFAPGACSVQEVWAALQPLCWSCFQEQQAAASSAEHAPSLPQWLAAQVL